MIDVERDGPVATVVLNNPGKRNALTMAAWDELAAAFVRLDADEDLRCIVVRGAGEEAFAAGADISEFPRLRANAEQAIAYGEKTAGALRAILECRHPSVAVIRGACTGGGLEIAACCDMRIASATARFGVPINRIGHAFAPPEMAPLLDLVGKAVVLELLLEGRILEADEAMAKGLVGRVVADEQLEEEANRAVSRIAAGAPLGARTTKWIARRLLSGQPFGDDDLRRAYEPCDGEDYAEGVRAFLSKERPNFRGR